MAETPCFKPFPPSIKMQIKEARDGDRSRVEAVKCLILSHHFWLFPPCSRKFHQDFGIFPLPLLVNEFHVYKRQNNRYLCLNLRKEGSAASRLLTSLFPAGLSHYSLRIIVNILCSDHSFAM